MKFFNSGNQVKLPESRTKNKREGVDGLHQVLVRDIRCLMVRFNHDGQLCHFNSLFFRIVEMPNGSHMRFSSYNLYKVEM